MKKKFTFFLINCSVFITLTFIFFFNYSNRVKATSNIQPWDLAGYLPYSLASHTSEVIEGTLFILSGSASFAHTHKEVITNILDNNGFLSDWNTSSLIDEPVIWHNTATWNKKFLYILGGYPDGYSGITDTLDSVYVTNTENLPQVWTKTASLSQRLALGGGVVVGNRIYYAGGFKRTAGGPFEHSIKVYKADINPIDGTLGTWTEAGELPYLISGFGMISAGNKITIIGGYNPTTDKYLSSVIEADVNPVDGNLTGWVNKDPLPRAIYRSGLTKIGNLVVSVGGVSYKPEFPEDFVKEITDDVLYAQIDNTGSVANWQTSENKFPLKLCCGSLAASDTHLYYSGGHDGGGYYDTVYFAEVFPFEPPPPPPPDSNLFDLPIYYDGRPSATETQFTNAFWNRLTSAFDHQFERNSYIPFTGDMYTLKDCPKNKVGIKCYDSHNGTDFSTIKNAEGNIINQDVYSVAQGKVEFTSDRSGNTCIPNKGGFGCVVIAKYNNVGGETLYTLYAHLEEIFVNSGDEISINTKIGLMGKIGCGVCGKHIHFGVLREIPNPQQIATKMTQHDWSELLYQIKPLAEEGRFTPFCTYRAPNGMTFSFLDPSGWKGNGIDPWSSNKNEGGCATQSPYLWKYFL